MSHPCFKSVVWFKLVLCWQIRYSRTSPYGHLTKPVTPPLWSPWLSPKWFPIVKYRTLVPVIRSPPYSGIRSVIPSQVAESPRYNGQSRPSSDNWLHIHLIQAAAGPADDNKRDDNKRKPNTCSWRHTKIVSCRFQLSTTVNKNTGFLCN